MSDAPDNDATPVIDVDKRRPSKLLVWLVDIAIGVALAVLVVFVVSRVTG